ncbi:MAG: MnmC family methyltransferase [Phormidesmis sp.]
MFTPVETGDGSGTFYSETFGEWFHSREGACNEAQQTYVVSSNLAERALADELKILDVCYGLGYNTAAALETIWQVNPQCRVEVEALEIDIEVARSAIAQGLTQPYTPKVQQVLQDLAAHQKATRQKATHQKIEQADLSAYPLTTYSLAANLRLGDARQQIQPLVTQGWQADIIFLDPFSPPHCPQLWTVEFLQRVAQCLQPQTGVLVTYSCAAAVRSALTLAGLFIGSTRAGGRKWPGTIASYRAAALPLLSPQEQEHLQTKAAVPYRDPSLRAAADEILKARAQSQAVSDLMPTGPWRRRWQRSHQKSSS